LNHCFFVYLVFGPNWVNYCSGNGEGPTWIAVGNGWVSGFCLEMCLRLSCLDRDLWWSTPGRILNQSQAYGFTLPWLSAATWGSFQLNDGDAVRADLRIRIRRRISPIGPLLSPWSLRICSLNFFDALFSTDIRDMRPLFWDPRISVLVLLARHLVVFFLPRQYEI
jgi:hypothetical protein